MARSFAAYRRWRGLDGRAETLIVPDGFVWGAAMFGPLWAMIFGRWRTAAALGVGWAIAAALSFVSGPVGAAVIGPLTSYWSGLVARGLEELWLADQGWRLEDVTVAQSLELAEANLIRADAAVAEAVERRW